MLLYKAALQRLGRCTSTSAYVLCLRRPLSHTAKGNQDYRKALKSGLLRIEDAAARTIHMKCLNISLVTVLMQNLESPSCKLLYEADRALQEFVREA
jgi:hypothetical protein